MPVKKSPAIALHPDGQEFYRRKRLSFELLLFTIVRRYFDYRYLSGSSFRQKAGPGFDRRKAVGVVPVHRQGGEASLPSLNPERKSERFPGWKSSRKNRGDGRLITFTPICPASAFIE